MTETISLGPIPILASVGSALLVERSNTPEIHSDWLQLWGQVVSLLPHCYFLPPPLLTNPCKSPISMVQSSHQCLHSLVDISPLRVQNVAPLLSLILHVCCEILGIRLTSLLHAWADLLHRFRHLRQPLA